MTEYDPATGTGTFIAELIRQVYHKFQGQEGIWSNYVENHLIPRLHGFELLMASYAMAHLKIDMLLQETDFKPTKNQRLKIYLTNSLEEYQEDDRTLFALARWLSEEAQQANDVKRDTPVDGDNVVGKIRSVETHGRAPLLQIYINDKQYFANVPEVAWNFYFRGQLKVKTMEAVLAIRLHTLGAVNGYQMSLPDRSIGQNLSLEKLKSISGEFITMKKFTFLFFIIFFVFAPVLIFAESKAEPTMEFVVPKTGDYMLFVRRANPKPKSAKFSITLAIE